MENLSKIEPVRIPKPYKLKRLAIRSMLHGKLKALMASGHFKGVKSGEPKGWALKK
jgi:hypothetical protein